MAEEPPQAGTQGKTARFYFFVMRVEKEEVGNPIKMKMLYTASLTVISEQEFLTVYSISGLEGKTREDTVIWSFRYAAARAPNSTAIGVLNKRIEKKKTLQYCAKPQALQGDSWFLRLRRELCHP